MNTEMTELQMQLLDFDETKRGQWQTKRYPYGAHIELTPRCNMNCIHCYLGKKHCLTELSYSRIIEILDILYDKGILFLTLTGGEILVRNDFWDIYLYAKRKGFLIELFSNGYLISDDLIEKLRKYPPLVVDISLYGANEETYRRVTGVSGAFERVVENCKKLISAGIRVTLKSPIINETYAEINDMKRLAEEIGAPISITFEICPSVDGDTAICAHRIPDDKILQYEFKNHERTEQIEQPLVPREGRIFSCKVGRNSFVIDYEGKMCPCMKMRHIAIPMTADNFDEIWERFGSFAELRLSEKAKCRNCRYDCYCDICPAEMELLHGDKEYVDERYCMLAKSRYGFYEKFPSGPDCC